jgi:hypothetical protein
MFPMSFEVELEGITVRDERRTRKYIRAALRLALFEWHDRFFRNHFNEGAFFRYAEVYKRRRTKGRRRENKNTPNVRTGRMRRMLDQSFRVEGSITEMRGVMTGPPYTDVTRPGQPNKAEEITFVSQSEQRILARDMERQLAELLNTDTTKQRLRIAG